MKNFEKLYEFVGNLSYRLFPDAGSIEHLKKLKQETDEAIKEPEDIIEYADQFFALISASVKAGFSYDELMIAIYKKSLINEKRIWELKEDGTHQHIE